MKSLKHLCLAFTLIAMTCATSSAQEDKWEQAYKKLMSNPEARAEIEAKGASKEELEALALTSEKVQRSIDGAAIRKVIVVPDRLVNIVT